ncbi:hypothetical protein thsbcT34_24280 [Burkholderia contaminans]
MYGSGAGAAESEWVGIAQAARSVASVNAQSGARNGRSRPLRARAAADRWDMSLVPHRILIKA